MSEYEHELKIGSTTQKFKLAKTENGKAYNVETYVPQFRDPLTFTMTDWRGGHGQHDFEVRDKFFEGQSIDTTNEGRVILGPLIQEQQEDDSTDLDGTPVVFCWFPAISKLMCATATNIYRLDSDGWDVATTTVTGVTDLKVFGAILYAARGTSTLYSYSTDGDTFTATDLTDGYAEKFLVSPNSDGTQDVLWKFKQPNEVSSTTDGRTAAAGGVQWTTPNYVGDTTTNIINLFLTQDELHIGREDGEWHLDSAGGIHPKRPDLINHRSTDNFKYIADWQAGVYHSESWGRMGEITGNDTYAPCGPLYEIGDIGKIGSIVGVASDGSHWLYVAIDEGTNTIIYKGREVRKEGILRWEWCPFVFLGTETTATLYHAQHSATDKRLWFGYTNSTAYVHLADDPTADSSYKFCASGWVRMSYDYGSNAIYDKLWQSCILECEGLQSGETVQIKYRKDTDTSATECVATTDVGTTNGVGEYDFTAELACNRIQFEIHLASDTNTATPEVKYFQARGIEKPTTFRIHDATYALGDDINYSAKTMRDLLRTAGSGTTLARFSDLRYNEYTAGAAGTDFYYVAMEAGYPKEVNGKELHGQNPELAVRARMREVNYT